MSNSLSNGLKKGRNKKSPSLETADKISTVLGMMPYEFSREVYETRGD
jgi:hypothetical protein